FNQSGLVLIFGRWASPVSSNSKRCISYGIGLSSTGCTDGEAGFYMEELEGASHEVLWRRWRRILIITASLTRCSQCLMKFIIVFSLHGCFKSFSALLFSNAKTRLARSGSVVLCGSGSGGGGSVFVVVVVVVVKMGS
ncbi:hypothetical protein Tco_0130455, partial [Tanacetum coccineum]